MHGYFTGIYSPKGINVPDPIQSICTRWGSDTFSYGSYSHVRVHSSGSDYDILAENVGRLFFAGEATTRQYPATMHGAYLSGLREAARILRAQKGRQGYSIRSVQKNPGPSNDLLIGLFKKPDLAFGKFLFVFDPLDQDPKSQGLMCVTLERISDGNSGGKVADKTYDDLSGQQFQLYTILSREQAQELLLAAGGNLEKMSYLFKALHLKLMGASGLGALGNVLATHIATVRRSRGRNRLLLASQNAL